MGVRDHEIQDSRLIMTAAYMSARLQRSKDFPELDEILAPLEKMSEEKKEQTPEEMFSIIQNFDACLKRKGG